MKSLKVLIVEDSEDDAELLLLHLARAGYGVQFERVQTAEAMENALATKEWDIIISDYQMPNFTGLVALEVLHNSGLDIPFILISGTIGEETAVEAMLAGVNDYMMKDKLARLVPAIERELNEAANRRAKREAEKALQASEERYRDLFENANDTIFTVDLEGNYTSVNKIGEELTGYSREEILQMNSGSLLSEKDARKVLETAAQKISGETQTTRYEVTITTKDKGQKNVEVSSRIIYENGIPTEIQGIARDVTQRKQLENDLRESEQRLQLALTAAQMGVWEQNFTTDEIYWSPECYEILESPNFGGTLNDFLQMIHPDDLELARIITDDAILKKEILNVEYRIITQSGNTLWIANHGITEYDENGAPLRLIGTVSNITERKQLELSQRESEENFRALVEATTQIVWTMDAFGESEDRLQWWTELTGQSYEDGKKFGWLEKLHPEDREKARFTWTKAFENFTFFEIVYRALVVSGEYRYFAVRGVPVFKQNGDFRQWMGTFTDITERKRVEEELKESERRLQLAISAAKMGVWEWNIKNNSLFWSETNYEIFGRTTPVAEAEDFFNSIHPDDLEMVREASKKTLEENTVYELEFRIIHPNGEIQWVNSRGIPGYDEYGRPLRFLGVTLDITESKNAQTELFKSEEKLRQSQKLESIGRLAGGIAHDFNNMLTAINGYSDLTLRRLRTDDPIRRNIEEIKEAGERSAALTHQLLAFSRQQILQPKIVNVNEIVSKTTGLLQRLIGEDIQIISALSSDIGQVEADPGQISQVIMNLAVNSRDAMPDGGTISIETENVYLDEEFVKRNTGVKVGDYVLLAVSDTGIGIDAETLTQIFEPFFTTKGIGKGTGLGLATVYGIINQSGGYINVVSTVGKGTTFEIYMPRHIDEIELISKDDVPTDLLQGAETILLVEDEHIVRRLTREILESYGYKIIEAQNGEEALAVCKSYTGRLDMLLTDIVMPKMGGHELAENLLKIYPTIKVLFTSGYTEDSQIRLDLTHVRNNFIHKPYSPEALALKVREIFDAES